MEKIIPFNYELVNAVEMAKEDIEKYNLIFKEANDELHIDIYTNENGENVYFLVKRTSDEVDKMNTEIKMNRISNITGNLIVKSIRAYAENDNYLFEAYINQLKGIKTTLSLLDYNYTYEYREIERQIEELEKAKYEIE